MGIIKIIYMLKDINIFLQAFYMIAHVKTPAELYQYKLQASTQLDIDTLFSEFAVLNFTNYRLKKCLQSSPGFRSSAQNASQRSKGHNRGIIIYLEYSNNEAGHLALSTKKCGQFMLDTFLNINYSETFRIGRKSKNTSLSQIVDRWCTVL